MIKRIICRWSLLRRRTLPFRFYSQLCNSNEGPVYYICKHLELSESRAHYLCAKHPYIRKMNEEKIKALIESIYELGLSKEVLVNEPLLFNLHPVTIKFRYKVLEECGLIKIKVRDIISYLPLVKQNTIGKLKQKNIIHPLTNVENQLASHMSQWPTSLTNLIYGDVNQSTLYHVRLKIIQRYLELVLDVSDEEFQRGLHTYPTIKHRPLRAINETLNILQSQIMMPNHKIKSNLYLIHVDPENLKKIIYNFRTIAGIDIKEILRLHPKIATKNYNSLLEIRNVLQEYGISNEAQRRCFDIYTLGPHTIRERLENAKKLPEFSTFFEHPRFLKMIHYNNTAIKRLKTLYNNNKKCLSLNILSGSSNHFKTFEKTPGDRLGKGKDLIFCISQSLGKEYSTSDIRNLLKRHPFWINIPIIQVKHVYDQLSEEFNKKEIFENCAILLYPWSKIRECLRFLETNKSHNVPQTLHEHLDLCKINKSQKLSLVLYLLERNHYFSGNGVWTEEKNKHVGLPHVQEQNLFSAQVT